MMRERGGQRGEEGNEDVSRLRLELGGNILGTNGEEHGIYIGRLRAHREEQKTLHVIA